MSEQVRTRNLQITNKYGMHARPASQFVKLAMKFDSEIIVCKEGTEVSGKSIMGLLTIEGYSGSVLTVTAVGIDAEAAIDALEELVVNKFYEE